MTEPLGQTERMQEIRKGIAEGRAMGFHAELIEVIDAISALRSTDTAIIDGVKQLAESARDAITDLRADAVAEFIDIRAEAVAAIGGLQDATVAEFADVRAEGVAAVALVRSDMGTALGTLNTNTATAIAADRARLTTLEQAIVAPTTGILARLGVLEARLTAAGIA